MGRRPTSGLMFGRPQPPIDPMEEARMRTHQTNHQLLFGPANANPMIRPEDRARNRSHVLGLPITEVGIRPEDAPGIADALRKPR